MEPRQFEKIIPIVSLIGWSLWIATSLSIGLRHAAFRFNMEIGLLGGGVALSYLAWKKPARWDGVWLAILSLYCLWRYYVGIIVFSMFPEMGGLTLKQAIADWWKHSTLNVERMASLPFGLFVLVSLVVWPIYTLIRVTRGSKQVS